MDDQVQQVKEQITYLDQTLDNLYNWATHQGVKIIIGLIFLWIGFKIINKVVKTINIILAKRDIDVTLASFLDGFMLYSLRLLLVIIVMSFVGLSTSGLIAFIGSAGLAIGLALQGSLANFAGGVIILLIRPFNVGDFIEGAGETGKVEKIGIFYTHMLTVDNKQTLIPNGTLANGIVTNYTAQDRRRVDLTFTVGYEEDVRRVKKALYEVIATETLILDDPAPFAAVSEHGDSAIAFIVRVWTKTEDYWTVHYNLLEKVKIKFDEENISIPFPQMDVHIKNSNINVGN